MIPSFQLLFQNSDPNLTDAELYRKDLRLAELAEPLGFSAIWCVEHHFDGKYSMCPDNTQLLSYLAAKTTSIELVPAAIILPWWTQPVRVAEKVAMLDILAGGRVRLGLGRGLSRMEYASLGMDMNEARERFDESAKMVLDALDKGVISGDGPLFPQPEATIAPAPPNGFRDRTVCIAMSPDSMDVAAELGAAMATFVQFPIEKHAPLIETYRESFRSKQGREAPAPTLTEFVYCAEDENEAKQTATEYISRYFTQVMRHYEFGGTHFSGTAGYESYNAVAEVIRAAGQEASAAAYVDAQTWGTPDQIIEKVKARREVIGDYHLNCAFTYAGLPHDKAEASMRLFSERVMPALKEL
ncbi:LLM class flavin-dependent oxidoreductase [Rhodococcus ruber]|uniref:LLM class flavin-dependent oxidoreductase n=1 Tax=Rhodococcus ruber TaxID=1830 RepID=UPI00265EC2CB|nr:LLM class flavin-dependent oxidoreductase [Rhodococcus ruber]MDO1481868.1 LLM class flavin-dependent oxidoreductase [Rhodococcus ruber]